MLLARSIFLTLGALPLVMAQGNLGHVHRYGQIDGGCREHTRLLAGRIS
jgi:hypothetical protein